MYVGMYVRQDGWLIKFKLLYMNGSGGGKGLDGR
jgi:hypothetical protein